MASRFRRQSREGVRASAKETHHDNILALHSPNRASARAFVTPAESYTAYWALNSDRVFHQSHPPRSPDPPAAEAIPSPHFAKGDPFHRATIERDSQTFGDCSGTHMYMPAHPWKFYSVLRSVCRPSCMPGRGTRRTVKLEGVRAEWSPTREDQSEPPEMFSRPEHESSSSPCFLSLLKCAGGNSSTAGPLVMH